MAPIVHEYSADANVAGPIETRQARVADTGEVGNSLARFGQAVSEVGETIHKREAQSEISDLTAKMAKAHADLTGQLHDTLKSADPGDDQITDKFMQAYDSQVDDIAGNIQTPEAQKYFQRTNAQMRSQFQISAMQGQSTLAGQKAVDDHKDLVSNLSSSLMKDPSSFNQVNEMAGMALQAKVDMGSLSQNDAQKLRGIEQSELAKSAVRGWIGIGVPEEAKKQLEAGQWDKYVDGDVKFQLQKEAETGITAKRVEGNRLQKAADDALAAKNEATEQQWINQLYGKGLSTQTIINDPNMTPEKKLQYVKMVDKANDDKLTTNASTFTGLFKNIHAPDGDPNKITSEDQLNNAFIKGGLSVQSLQQLRSELSGKKTEAGKIESDLKSNFLKSVEAQLVKSDSMGIKDPVGLTQYQGFLSNFLPEYEKQRSAGKTSDNLLNPQSKDYMGNMVKPFLRSDQEKMNSIVNSFKMTGEPTAPAPTATPSVGAPANNVRVAPERRREGEAPQDYLKRIGKS